MFRTSVLHNDIDKQSCKVHRINWLHVKSSQSNANFTKWSVNFIMNFWSFQRTSGLERNSEHFSEKLIEIGCNNTWWYETTSRKKVDIFVFDTNSISETLTTEQCLRCPNEVWHRFIFGSWVFQFLESYVWYLFQTCRWACYGCTSGLITSHEYYKVYAMTKSYSAEMKWRITIDHKLNVSLNVANFLPSNVLMISLKVHTVLKLTRQFVKLIGSWIKGSQSNA